MTTATARAPSRIYRLVQNHKDIDHLIRVHPSCPRQVSREVDRLMVEAETTRDFYLKS